jgi:hypothetical protein
MPYSRWEDYGNILTATAWRYLASWSHDDRGGEIRINGIPVMGWVK